MIDYTQTEDYACPECTWSLHVEKTIWDEFDEHQMILDYIQQQVLNHVKTSHGGKKMYKPLSQDYSTNPFMGYSGSSLTILT